MDAGGVDFVELTKTLNISATGASIATTHVIRSGQVLQLTFPAPSPSSASTVPSETPPISARLKRDQAAEGLRLLGLEFVRPLE